MTEFPEILKDGDLELRRIKPTFELSAQVFAILEKNRERLHWMPWIDAVKTQEDEFIGLSRLYNNEQSYLIFVNNEIAGGIGSVKIHSRVGHVEIGYWLAGEFEGKGIMSRSVRLIERNIFETGDWNKVEIRVDAKNTASQNVAKRNGYTLDGTLRQHHRYNDGTFGDMMMFSKLKQEFDNNGK